MIADANFVYALLDRRDERHEAAVAWFRSSEAEFETTPLVMTEIDYMLRRRLGADATRAFRRDLAAGAYLIGWWPDAARACVQIAESYADLSVSLADASLVAYASRLGTVEIATFDERHFRAMRPLSHGTAFRLLPADA